MSRDERLGAVDVFHLRSHQELIAQGLAGNACALVLDLEGKLDRESLEARVHHALAVMPELGQRLGYRYGIDPVWKDGARPVLRYAEQRGRALEDLALALIETRIDGTEPWEVHLLRGDAHDAVVLRWFQPFTDARGMTRLAAWLGSSERRDPPSPESRRRSADRLLAGIAPRERVALARRYFRHVMKLAKTPILSLHGTSGRRPGRVRMLRRRFEAPVTEAFYRSLRARAQLADTSVLLYAAARMLDRALFARGCSPPRTLCPVPLSLDGTRDGERMLGNHLTMMMMALDRDDLAEESRAVVSLARQRRAIVRDKLDVGMVAALDLVRHMPPRMYSWASRRPFAGERSSLVVSNPGDLGLESFLGRPLRDAFLMPTVLAPPGFQVIADRSGGRLSVSVLFREGAIGEDEVRALWPAFERDLLS